MHAHAMSAAAAALDGAHNISGPISGALRRCDGCPECSWRLDLGIMHPPAVPVGGRARGTKCFAACSLQVAASPADDGSTTAGSTPRQQWPFTERCCAQ